MRILSYLKRPLGIGTWLSWATCMIFLLHVPNALAQQVGDAYISFNNTTGEFRMCPGHAVAASAGINSFGVEMNPAIGTLSTNVNDYYLPSGSWPLFFPQTGANPGNAFGSAFQTWSLPNVTGGGDSLNSTNLVIGSPWVVQTGGRTGATGADIAGTTAVYASTIAGYEGLPEFSFGTFGPTNLTEAQALAALGATANAGLATGNRVYSLQGVSGSQQFKIYIVGGNSASAPDAPTNLSATAALTSLEISFDAPASDGGAAITNYEYSTDDGTTWTAFSPAVTTSPVTLTGLTPDTSYSVKLRALNAEGASDASAAVVASTLAPTAPDAPTNLSATAALNSLEISFDAPASDGGAAITNYEYSTDDGTTWTAFSPAVTTSPATLSGLSAGTEYTVALRAINSVGAGTASDNLTEMTLHGPLMVATTTLNSGDANCAEGGVQIDIGYDDDLSNALETAEITSTQYACNGSDGTNGTHGTNGTYGFTVLVETSDASTTDCANGGVQIDVGYDDGLAADGTTTAGSADDGSLDAGEIDTTEIVCNGVDGTDGRDGTYGANALITRTEASTDDCPDGGETIQVGLDDNANGELDSDEVEQTVHVCDGLNGINGDNGAPGQNGTSGANALVSVTAEPAGDNCAHGGDKVETGLDDDANGTLDEAEVDHTMYLCDGAPGADGMHGADGADGESGNRALTDIVTLAIGSEECASGGVVVRSGIDTDRDRILDDDEVDETVVVCNGTDGTVDEDKNGTDDRLEVEAQASCAATSNAISLWGLLALAGMLTRRRRR